MKNIALSFLLSLVFLISIMSSCRAPKELVYKDFQNLSIEKLGFASSLLKIDLIYYNPNNFGLQLKRIDLDVYIDNKFLGHTTQEYEINIPRRADFALPVQMDLDMKNVLKNALTSILNNEVMLKITGTVKVGKANIFKTFQINYEEKHELPVF